MMLQPFALSPDAQARCDSWLARIDEHIVLLDQCQGNASRLHHLRGKLIANTTSDGLFAMWLSDYAEALRDQFRYARGAYERHAEKAHEAARAHATAAAKATRDHRAAARKAALDYAAMAREAAA